MSAGERIAGAPISWGVCEVPGWGHQLGPDPAPEVDRLLDAYAASGAGVLVWTPATSSSAAPTRPS